MTRRNILISSTRQWNPGDEFIRKGIKKLIEQVTGSNHNWLLWNRNPDLFVHGYTDSRMRTDFLSNSLREPVLDLVDLVVFAGTPEWTGAPVERIYRELLKYPDIPVLVLGVGSGSPNLDLRDYELEVLSRDNVLITTRDDELAKRLNMLLKSTKAIPLPCPALFCADDRIIRGSSPRIGLIIQSSSVCNQSIGEDLVQEILECLKEVDGNLPIDIICLYIDEYMRFSRLHLGHSCITSYEPDDLLASLANYSTIISTRLHGAIAGLSLHIPSILLAEEGSYRVRAASKLFGPFLPVMSVRDAFTHAFEWSKETRERGREIKNFQTDALHSYTRLLGEFLGYRSPLSKCA